MDPFDLTFADPAHPFHVHHMELALAEAAAAAAEDEVPVGAVVIHPERGVIGSAHNQRERLRDPTAHAEMIAITQAAAALGSWRLDRCILYVTLEPCPMCAGALMLARIGRVVFGAWDPKAGACGSVWDIPRDRRATHHCEVVGGVRETECADLLLDFFAAHRGPGAGDFSGAEALG